MTYLPYKHIHCAYMYVLGIYKYYSSNSRVLLELEGKKENRYFKKLTKNSTQKMIVRICRIFGKITEERYRIAEKSLTYFVHWGNDIHFIDKLFSNDLFALKKCRISNKQ